MSPVAPTIYFSRFPPQSPTFPLRDWFFFLLFQLSLQFNQRFVSIRHLLGSKAKELNKMGALLPSYSTLRDLDSLFCSLLYSDYWSLPPGRVSSSTLHCSNSQTWDWWKLISSYAPDYDWFTNWILEKSSPSLGGNGWGGVSSHGILGRWSMRAQGDGPSHRWTTEWCCFTWGKVVRAWKMVSPQFPLQARAVVECGITNHLYIHCRPQTLTNHSNNWLQFGASETTALLYAPLFCTWVSLPVWM